MALTSSLNTARSSLNVLSERTAVVSRNVANAQNDYVSRKIVHTLSGQNGSSVSIATVVRAEDSRLFQNMISSNAAAGRQEAMVDGLDQLNRTIGDVSEEFSPAAAVAALADSIQQYSAAPHQTALGQNAVFKARDMVTNLNEATAIVQKTRSDADKAIADSVTNVNTMLSRFEELNGQIINGTRAGSDVTDLLDNRDLLLKDISREIGIRTFTRDNNDMTIYTDSGVTLFETTARDVSFTPRNVLGATEAGNAVFVDGVPITGASPMPVTTGRISGLANIRDNVAVTYQSQLDEVARGLIATFAETDQSGSALPAATGMFSYSGSPAVPAAGTVIPGLAGQISLNAAVDPSQGGDPAALRDGGINGAAYVYNPSGAAGFSDRLRDLYDQFSAPMTFDADAQLGTSTSLLTFSSDSVGWLQELRQNATAELDFRSAVFERSSSALSNATGINLDIEMTLLLELERSYQATSRLISTVDTMFASLLEAAR
jgi:flagellar hook-associated protein 1